jgi:predicted CoA-binding protein
MKLYIYSGAKSDLMMDHPLYEEIEIGLDRLLIDLEALGGLPEAEDLLRRARRLVIRASAASRPSVAVVGASTDRSKYGNKAVRAFREAGFDVYPVNPRAARVEGLRAYPDLDALPVDTLDRVSLYVPPAVGLAVLEQVARKRVGEVWLNPGAESPELVARAEAMGLNVVQACSILAVGAHPDRV